MLIRDGKLSLWWFSITTSVVILALVESFCQTCQVFNLPSKLWWVLPLYFLSLTAYLRLRYSGFQFQVAVRSVFLGAVFAVGAFLTLYSSLEWGIFGVYMSVMSFFHYSEFLTIAWCNPKTLSLSSFLLNHSTQYNLAAIASWLEFLLEVYLIPDVKKFPVISCLGFVLCIFGEGLRKSAMITGSTNFAHVVQTEKHDDHQLVTHGIYQLCRHPSYVGWFYWSIGTQLLLLNPLCVLGYGIVSWRFFRERITHEEHTLLYFFGRDYMEYQKAVGTGLPGIRGFLLEE